MTSPFLRSFFALFVVAALAFGGLLGVAGSTDGDASIAARDAAGLAAASVEAGGGSPTICPGDGCDEGQAGPHLSECRAGPCQSDVATVDVATVALGWTRFAHPSSQSAAFVAQGVSGLLRPPKPDGTLAG